MSRRLLVGLLSLSIASSAVILASCGRVTHIGPPPSTSPTATPVAYKDAAEKSLDDADAAMAKPIALNRSVGTMRAMVTYPVRDRSSGYDRAMRIRVWVGERLAIDTLEDLRPADMYRATLQGGRAVLLLDTYSGGAHCCMGTMVLASIPDAQRATSTKADWGNVGYKLMPAADESGSVFLTGDDASSYAFSSFAASRFPIKIVSFRAGRLVDVTNAYQESIRRDATQHWREYIAAGSSDGRDSALVAYLADEYRLGNAQSAWSRVRKARGAAHSFYTEALVWLNQNGYVNGSKTRPGA